MKRVFLPVEISGVNKQTVNKQTVIEKESYPMKNEINNEMKNAKKGQGMVEYIGAVLVAAAIVVGLIAIAPGTLTTLFNTTFSRITSSFSGSHAAL